MVKNLYNLLITIPAYNEQETILKVISKIPKKIKGVKEIKILVIDDGSIDSTPYLVEKMGVILIRHIVNCGLGAAIKTAFTYAKKSQTDILVTIDADGQHNPKDLPRVIKPIMNKKWDVVIGSRMIRKYKSMPLRRKAINILANIFTFLLSGIWTTDSQSGYRAFSRKAIKSIDLITQRMEVSSEIFSQIRKNKLTYYEVPIKPIYTNYSLRKGQMIINAPNVILKLLINLARR